MDVDVVDELNEVLARLAQADPFSYADRDSIIALERGLSAYSCTLAKAVASFAEGGEWAADGAQSAPAWIAASCHLPHGEVRKQLRRGAALSSMPVVAEAFSAGEIGPAHVDVLVKAAKAVAHADPEAFARCEEGLVNAASVLGFVPFSNAVTYFTQMADPDGAEESDMARRARRNAYVVESMSGMYYLGGTLDPISGAIVAGELGRLNKCSSRPTGPRPKRPSGVTPRWANCPGPPPNAGPTPWSRWRCAPRGPRRPTGVPSPSSVSW